jgi:hypothetical protein
LYGFMIGLNCLFLNSLYSDLIRFTERDQSLRFGKLRQTTKNQYKGWNKTIHIEPEK